MKPKYLTKMLLGLAALSIISTSHADVLIDFGSNGQQVATLADFEGAIGAPPSGTVSGTIYTSTGDESSRIGDSFAVLNFFNRGTTTFNGVGSFNSALAINDLENDYATLSNERDITVEITNLNAFLSPNTTYTIYMWGQGDQLNQGSAFVFDINNINDPTAGVELQTADGVDNSTPDPTITALVVSYTFTTPAVLPDSLQFDWFRTLEGPTSSSGFAGMPGLAITGATVETTFDPGPITSFSANGAEINVNACEFPALIEQIPTFTANFSNITTFPDFPINADDPGISYLSSDTAVATVSATGEVTPTGLGNATITATFEGANATIPVTVTQVFAPDPIIVNRYSFNNTDATTDTLIANGGAVEPDLVGSADGIVYDASYDGNGLLLFDNVGTVPGSDPAVTFCPYIDLPNGLFSSFAKTGDGTEGQSFTIEWWANTAGTGGAWQRFFSFGSSTVTGSAVGLEPNESDIDCINDTGIGSNLFDINALRSNNVQTRIEVRDTTGGSGVFFDRVPYPANQMIHWVMTYDLDCNVISLYQDGTLFLATSGIRGEDIATISDVNNWIGRSASSDNALFAGAFDEVRFYTGVMDELGIAQSSSAGPDATLPQPDPGNLVSLTAEPASAIFTKNTVLEEATFTIIANFENASFEVTNFNTVTYDSSDFDVVDFDSDGTINFLDVGTANITVTFAQSTGTQSVVIPVTVEDVSTVTVSSPTTTLMFDGAARQTAQFSATADFDTITDIEVTNSLDTFWSSADSSVATVDINGLVTPVATGTTTIEADFCGVIGSISVTVAEVARKAPLLKHHYTFNYPDGTTVTAVPDSTGSQDGEVINNGFSYSGGALNLSGGTIVDGDTTAPFVDLPNGMISGLDLTSGEAHTFEVWVTRTSTANWERIFSFGSSQGAEGTSGRGQTYLYLTAQKASTGNPSVAFTTNSNGGETVNLETLEPLATTETHIVVTYDTDDNIGKIYIDGTLAGFDTPTQPLSVLDDVNNWLGRAQWADPLPTMAINEFNIYCGVFNDADVLASTLDTTTVLTVAADLALCVVDFTAGTLNVSAEGLSANTDYHFEQFNLATSLWEDIANSGFTATGTSSTQAIASSTLGDAALIRLSEGSLSEGTL